MKQITSRRMAKKLSWIKSISYLLIAVGFFVFGSAYAADQTLGDVADNITGSMQNLAKLIMAMSYVMGMGFAVGAAFKFKAHKDNPQQIPVGTPIALFFIAAALIFLPSVFDMAGYTLFKENKQEAGVEGINPYTNSQAGSSTSTE